MGQGGSASGGGGQSGADEAFRLPPLASLAAASTSAGLSPPPGGHFPLPSLRYRMLGQAGAAQQSFPSMDALAGSSYEQAASGGMGESMSPPALGADAGGRKMSTGQKRKNSATPGDTESEAGKAKKVCSSFTASCRPARRVLTWLSYPSQRRLEHAMRVVRARFGA